jgi:hypothetical protein
MLAQVNWHHRRQRVVVCHMMLNKNSADAQCLARADLTGDGCFPLQRMGAGKGGVGGRAASVSLWMLIAAAAGLVTTSPSYKGFRIGSESSLDLQWCNVPVEGPGQVGGAQQMVRARHLTAAGSSTRIQAGKTEFED